MSHLLSHNHFAQPSVGIEQIEGKATVPARRWMDQTDTNSQSVTVVQPGVLQTTNNMACGFTFRIYATKKIFPSTRIDHDRGATHSVNKHHPKRYSYQNHAQPVSCCGRDYESFAPAQNQAQPPSDQGVKPTFNDPSAASSCSNGMSFLDTGQVTVHPP